MFITGVLWFLWCLVWRTRLSSFKSVFFSFFFFFFLQIYISRFIFFLLISILIFFFFFYFTILYWFCHTSTWIRHGCTCVPNPEPPSHLPPDTIPLVYLYLIFFRAAAYQTAGMRLYICSYTFTSMIYKCSSHSDEANTKVLI